jgi:predicted transcriptional regulator
MGMVTDAGQNKRTRAVIVELLNIRHSEQKSRPDHVLMWHMLRDLGCDVSENEVLTILQDLCDRGYVNYRADRDRATGRIAISQIQLTPKGRDLIEGTIADPAFSF